MVALQLPAAGARHGASSQRSAAQRHKLPVRVVCAAAWRSQGPQAVSRAPHSSFAASPREAVEQSSRRRRRADGVVVHSLDYVSTSADDGVLRLPARTELEPAQMTHVFGYARDLTSKYFIGRVIGAGSFGVVRECMEAASGRRLAVKTIGKVPKRGAPTPRYLLKLRTEVEIMQQLGFSLDAVNLKDVFEDNDSIHLVMQLCEGGALLERIERLKYSEAYIARIVRSILRFVSQCHAKGIIYRDIKPDNFLFVSNEPDAPLKATDFGLSIRHWPDEPKLTSRSGTPAYMAPELVMQSYDEKADVWSVGMLCYQLLTGRFPFWEDVRTQSLTDVWRAIMTQEINWEAEELDQLSQSARGFLQQLLRRDPKMRPSAQVALDHPWLREEGQASNLPLSGSVVQRLQRFSTYGHLKQVVLRMIAGEMASQDQSGVKKYVTDLKELFKELDTDHSGSISLKELSDGLRNQGYVLTDPEIEQLVRKVDANHDGDIALSEFLTTLIDWQRVQREQGQNWQLYLDHAFRKLDKDGDGFISLDELLDQLPLAPAADQGAGAQAEFERRAEAKLMLREADTNGDGKISKEEFADLLRDSHAPDSLSFYDDRLAPHMGRWRGTSSSSSDPSSIPLGMELMSSSSSRSAEAASPSPSPSRRAEGKRGKGGGGAGGRSKSRSASPAAATTGAQQQQQQQQQAGGRK